MAAAHDAAELVATAAGATSVAYQEVVLSLKVTPHITPDGRVMMRITVLKNDLGQFLGQFLGWTVTTKEVVSDVIVENGGTVVIGGIYQQRDKDDTTRVPFLGDLPYVGFLFRHRNKVEERSELLVMLTPKIIDNALAMR